MFTNVRQYCDMNTKCIIYNSC